MKTSDTPALMLLKPLHSRATSAAGATNLRAVVLLAGAVGTSTLAAATGRAAIHWPIDSSSSLLGHWRQQVEPLAASAADGMVLRVMGSNSNGQAVEPSPASSNVQVRMEHDPAELRGTGGVLRDVAADYPDEALLVVASAGQLLVDSLAEAVRELAACEADVVLLSDDGAVAGGVMLVRCGCTRVIPSIGYVDLKEQGLPLIARQHRVQVIHRQRPLALPLRTRGDYIRALRWYHRTPRMRPVTDPFEEDWRPVFALWEEGAKVDPSARLHDSVVLAGGRVERGAMVVRSVVCPGGVVGLNQTVIDEVVSAANRRQGGA